MRPQNKNIYISNINSRRQPETSGKAMEMFIFFCIFFIILSFQLTIYFNICFSTICYLSMNIAEFTKLFQTVTGKYVYIIAK